MNRRKFLRPPFRFEGQRSDERSKHRVARRQEIAGWHLFVADGRRTEQKPIGKKGCRGINLCEMVWEGVLSEN
jgi:hypothetical protein